MYMYSMDAYKALQEKDAKLLHLQKRRKRLAALLAEEREQLHVSIHVSVLRVASDVVFL